MSSPRPSVFLSVSLSLSLSVSCFSCALQPVPTSAARGVQANLQRICASIPFSLLSSGNRAQQSAAYAAKNHAMTSKREVQAAVVDFFNLVLGVGKKQATFWKQVRRGCCSFAACFFSSRRGCVATVLHGVTVCRVLVRAAGARALRARHVQVQHRELELTVGWQGRRQSVGCVPQAAAASGHAGSFAAPCRRVLLCATVLLHLCCRPTCSAPPSFCLPTLCGSYARFTALHTTVTLCHRCASQEVCGVRFDVRVPSSPMSWARGPADSSARLLEALHSPAPFVMRDLCPLRPLCRGAMTFGDAPETSVIAEAAEAFEGRGDFTAALQAYNIRLALLQAAELGEGMDAGETLACIARMLLKLVRPT